MVKNTINENLHTSWEVKRSFLPTIYSWRELKSSTIWLRVFLGRGNFLIFLFTLHIICLWNEFIFTIMIYGWWKIYTYIFYCRIVLQTVGIDLMLKLLVQRPLGREENIRMIILLFEYFYIISKVSANTFRLLQEAKCFTFVPVIVERRRKYFFVIFQQNFF